jgi:hypothetical protein
METHFGIELTLSGHELYTPNYGLHSREAGSTKYLQPERPSTIHVSY